MPLMAIVALHSSRSASRGKVCSGRERGTLVVEREVETEMSEHVLLAMLDMYALSRPETVVMRLLRQGLN